ncbi:cytochrome P450 [Leptodontidium sp. MPI-SDFR-AT-0119]|nr:cytochrome P450 [Leptodontidium sp. MPI-SDFR-AT-0119]
MSPQVYQFVLRLLFGSFLLFIFNEAKKIFYTRRSPLSKIPGPWYAPFTTLHLKYGFATGKIWKTAEAAHKNYGPIVRLGPRQVWISDKKSMKQILSSIDLPKVAMYAEISRDRYNPGLFGEIRHEPHKRLKRFLSPAFTVAYTDNLDTLFAQCIGDLMQKFQTSLGAHMSTDVGSLSAGTDLMVDLHNVALDIMGECTFGKGFGQTNPDKEAEEGIEEQVWKSIPLAIFHGLARRYQNVYFKRFLRAFGIEFEFDWPAQMITAIHHVVERRKKKDSGESRPDLLQHMIQEGKSLNNDTQMSTRQIVDQMSEILLAGSETTAGTIACLFLELARNPKVKAKLLASLPVRRHGDPIIGNREIRNEGQYKYLNACIKENLRLHPIASELGRRTGNRWVSLMGYDLPPRTVISASFRNLHHNAEYWPQPLRFWPERWLEGDEQEDAPSPDMDAYFPFSAGKHSCIGINFAWAEMRMLAANFFSRFDLDEVPGQEIDFRQFITMQFKTGSWNVLIRSRIEKFETSI